MQNYQGYTPLPTACLTNDAKEEMEKLLLEHKVDTELQTKVGELDSLRALMRVRGRMEGIVRLLLEAGANPNAPSQPTARLPGIRGLAKYSCPSAGPSRRHKRPGHHRVNGDGTCLHQTASAGSAQYIRMLVQSGADVSCRDENDSTPLTLSSKEGHLDVVQLLLQPGANVDAVVSDGSSTLFTRR